MKKIVLCGFVMFFFASSIFAADIVQSIDTIYSSYVKPVCLGLVILAVLVGGVANIGDIRKGGEHTRTAFISWGTMVLYAIIIFVVVAGLKSIIMKFWV
jgi:hypothetical protein